MAQKSEYTGAQLTFSHHVSVTLGSMDTHVHEGVGPGVGLLVGSGVGRSDGTGDGRDVVGGEVGPPGPGEGAGVVGLGVGASVGRTDGDGVGRDEGDDVGRGDGAGVGPGVGAAADENGLNVQPVLLEAQAPPTASTAVGAQVVHVPDSAQSPAQLLPPA